MFAENSNDTNMQIPRFPDTFSAKPRKPGLSGGRDVGTQAVLAMCGAEVQEPVTQGEERAGGRVSNPSVTAMPSSAVAGE